MADFTINGLAELDAVLSRLENPEEALNKACAQTGELLAGRAKNLTPVDTGQLRSGWKRSRPENGRVTVYNNTEYAGHVEWGHRQETGKYIPAIGKRLKKPFVEGRHMLRDAVAESEEYLEDDIAEILEAMLE